MVIELMHFRLSPGASVDEFLEADRRVQTEFAYHQPGLVRRTTARSDDGNWIVIDHWRSAADAEACNERWDQDPIAQAFMRLIEEGTVHVERFSTL